jgi:hypothetical protein
MSPIEDSTAGHAPASPPITANENEPPDAATEAIDQNSHAVSQIFRLLTPDSCLLAPSS